MNFMYHTGVACEDLVGKPDQTTLLVFIPELMPTVSGEVITSQKYTIDVDNTSPGSSTKSAYVCTNCVICEYLYTGAGIERPDITFSEKVMIRVLAGTTKYFWSPIETDSAKRTTEHVTRYLKAGPEDTAHTDANSYKVSLSSIDGEQGFVFRTTKNNGEEIVFECIVDLAEGKWSVQDDKKNFVRVDGKNNVLEFGVPGSTTHMTKESITHTTTKLTIAAASTDITGALKVTGATTLIGPLSATSAAFTGAVTGPSGAVLHKP